MNIFLLRDKVGGVIDELLASNISKYTLSKESSAATFYKIILDYLSPALPPFIWTIFVGENPIGYVSVKSDDEEYNCKITLTENWKEEVLANGVVYFANNANGPAKKPVDDYSYEIVEKVYRDFGGKL